MTTGTILLIVLIVLLLGGGGAWYGPRAGWEGPQYGGLAAVVLIILIVLLVTGNIHLGR